MNANIMKEKNHNHKQYLSKFFHLHFLSLLNFFLLIPPSSCYFGLNEVINPGPLRDRYLNEPPEWDGNEPMAMEGFQAGFVKFLVHEISDALRDGVEQLREWAGFVGHWQELIACIADALTRLGQAKRRRKRDRLENRFTDTNNEELRIVKCVKTSYVIQDLPKLVYNFVPTNWILSALMTIVVIYAPGVKVMALIMLPPPKWFYYGGKTLIRIIGVVIKGALTIIQGFLPWLRGVDIELSFYFGREVGQVVIGIFTTIFELIMDIANFFNEEFFAEGTDWLRCFTDHDNKISLTELIVYAECTYGKAAGSHDVVRIDGSARIDDYYEDFAAKIQTVEFYWELNTFQRRALWKTKEQFCIATWIPTTNEMSRIEIKLFYTWAMMRQDRMLDPSEMACITLILANFKFLIDRPFDSSPSGFVVFPEQWENITARIYDHIDDIISAIPKLDLDETARDEDNKALHNVAELARMLLNLAKKIENGQKKLLPMAEKLAKAIDIVAGEKCPGDQAERLRLIAEFDLINIILDGKIRLKKLDCENNADGRPTTVKLPAKLKPERSGKIGLLGL